MKSISKIVSTITCIAVIFCLSTVPVKAATNATTAANTLYQLGLFLGTGQDDQGNPTFELDRIATRQEALVMLVRLLGKEDIAQTGTWDMPFFDVDTWAQKYVGYAYGNGLTTGTSATTFGGKEYITANQYITFLLRALGYQSGTDFVWNQATELSNQIGLTNGEYDREDHALTRGEIAQLSYQALFAAPKESKQFKLLLVSLYIDGAVSDEELVAAGLESILVDTTVSIPSIVSAEVKDGKLTIHYCNETTKYSDITLYFYISDHYDSGYTPFIYAPQTGIGETISCAVPDKLDSSKTCYIRVHYAFSSGGSVKYSAFSDPFAVIGTNIECYAGTSFPTFQSITGVACVSSYIDSNGMIQMPGYISNSFGYVYKDTDIGLAKYADYLLLLGAKPKYGHAISSAGIFYYELDGKVICMTVLSTGDNEDVVIFPDCE